MPTLLTLALLFCCLLPLAAQDQPKPDPEKSAIPSIADSIPKAVSEKITPSIFTFHKGLVTAVSAANETAQIHTLQGINHLHGGWEFEARRHFAAAIQSDPDCLMAHWGLVMTMLSSTPETDPHRLAATERLIHLITENHGTEIERGFAYALIKYIEEGPKGAETAFRKIEEKFPNDIQATIFASLFGRGGYSDTGDITPSQAEAEKKLSDLIERYPESALPIHALLVIRAEAPDLQPSLELARKLCQLVPDYAPYFHLLGHYEWRCGEHTKASSAFSRAASLYSIWMKENKITPADCPEWIRAESYRVVALASKGDFDNAIASAEKIARSTLDPNRPSAPGTRLLLWDAKTLPARVFMRRNAPGDTAKALASLPTPKETEAFREHSLFYWWIDGMRIALDAKTLLEAKNIEKTTQAIEALSFHGETMSKRRVAASSIGEYHDWRRSFFSLEILAAELRGHLALAGPEKGHGSAFNWFRAASDRQRPATMLNPPLILSPMATHLGDYYIAINKPNKAVKAYTEALNAFPNDQQTLDLIEKARELALTHPPDEPEKLDPENLDPENLDLENLNPENQE